MKIERKFSFECNTIYTFTLLGCIAVILYIPILYLLALHRNYKLNLINLQCYLELMRQSIHAKDVYPFYYIKFGDNLIEIKTFIRFIEI